MKKLIITGFLILGGVFIMAFVSKDQKIVEANKNVIEDNVKAYFENFNLDPEKVKIEQIGDPETYPNGEEQFFVYVHYLGDPQFSISLKGDPETWKITSQKKEMIAEIFNAMFLEEKLDELKPAIDYLTSLNIDDPLRIGDSKVRYFYTSLGINKTINSEIVKIFENSDKSLKELRIYIKENWENIHQLNGLMDIRGAKKGLSLEDTEKMRTQLSNILPKGEYNVGIGISNWETGAHEGLFETIKIE